MNRQHKIAYQNGCDRPLFSRRGFMRAAAGATTAATFLPSSARAKLNRLERRVSIGLIADLHNDIMHDGPTRLDAFLSEMKTVKPDAIMQLGDFAYPAEKNREVIDKFNQAHARSLHVIGNHDTDSGHTVQQCLDVWGMTGRYYAAEIEGLRMLVLDGNDKGSPSHKGGYASYVGPEQLEWLEDQLATSDGPVVVVSHQPLAGAYTVDNAEAIQTILARHAEKVAMCLNGHSHIDSLVRVSRVSYLHINSASYQWVGGAHKNKSYSKEIHEKHPWINHTCPYRDALFATITFDPESASVSLEGRKSEWVAQSPAQLGVDAHPQITNGEEVAPRIRSRRLEM